MICKKKECRFGFQFTQLNKKTKPKNWVIFEILFKLTRVKF